MSTITVKDGTTIYYKDWSKGPVVTFSHGWPLSTTEGRIILLCQPGGFENFFDAAGKGMMDKASPAQMEQIMNRYGMEMLGPPIFPPTAAVQH